MKTLQKIKILSITTSILFLTGCGAHHSANKFDTSQYQYDDFSSHNSVWDYQYKEMLAADKEKERRKLELEEFERTFLELQQSLAAGKENEYKLVPLDFEQILADEKKTSINFESLDLDQFEQPKGINRFEVNNFNPDNHLIKNIPNYNKPLGSNRFNVNEFKPYKPIINRPVLVKPIALPNYPIKNIPNLNKPLGSNRFNVNNFKPYKPIIKTPVLIKPIALPNYPKPYAPPVKFNHPKLNTSNFSMPKIIPKPNFDFKLR